ncbi:hypothetical protein NG798_04585 [Ancylothrix sp. C2]|uniref:hypothetical protein n=1 Tax=Ancylothrix sp. D3o TaxID=2953691 RepID=UPI0021BB156F|nr:hypothetical protein [Ancylothrix sp. D3o]MCT7949056.1 hypothetical protein [Ancylothrix sp. D3o]
MTQELTNLRHSILAGRYDEALEIIDELEAMSKKDVLLKIQSFLVRVFIPLIKNSVEQRLTNSWAVSIADSLRKIKNLNLKENKSFYYVKQDEWQSLLEESLDDAIGPASTEVREGIYYNRRQLAQLIEKAVLIETTQKLLALIYSYSGETLEDKIDEILMDLPGGNSWGAGEMK